MQFWSELLEQIQKWKFWEYKKDKVSETFTRKDMTNHYSFLKGWITNIKSFTFLWINLKQKGFTYLCCRSFNQDSIEHLFFNFRQHGVVNTNPTCYQFTTALKTIVVNNMSQAVNSKNNCDLDDCTPLDDSRYFILNDYEHFASPSEEEKLSINDESYLPLATDNISFDDDFSISRVAGTLLNLIKVPKECETCKKALFTAEISERNILKLLDDSLE